MHAALWAQPSTLDANFAIQERFQGWIAAYVRAMRVVGKNAHIMDELDERLIVAMRYLMDHPLSKRLEESNVARAAGMSTSQVNRLFASHYGTTPKRHFDERRREFASNALRFTDSQIKTIAFKLGFSSLSHFTKWFVRHFAATPTQFRQTGSEARGRKKSSR